MSTKFEQLSGIYKNMFPSYDINPRWLGSMESQGVNVGDPRLIARIVGGDAAERQKIFYDELHLDQKKAILKNNKAVNQEMGEDWTTMAPEKIDYYKERARQKEFLRSQQAAAQGVDPRTIPLPMTADETADGMWQRLKDAYYWGHDYGANMPEKFKWKEQQAVSRFDPNKKFDLPNDPSAAADFIDNPEYEILPGKWEGIRATRREQKDALGRVFSSYSKSTPFEAADPIYREGRGWLGNIGFQVGAAAADIPGYGSRKFIWNLHPQDQAYTNTSSLLQNEEYGNMPTWAARLGALATAEAVGLGSGNYDPSNLAEGGRGEGFAAISADENDPRKSTNWGADLVFQRGMLGRTGKLLPWDQFTIERPGVSYEKYSKYKDYLSGKDPSLLEKATFGLVKGTTEGIDGPEMRIMGYRVTPEGVGAGVATAIAAPLVYHGLKGKKSPGEVLNTALNVAANIVPSVVPGVKTMKHKTFIRNVGEAGDQMVD